MRNSLPNSKVSTRTGGVHVEVCHIRKSAATRINRKLDEEEEDRVAILTAPPGLGGVAVLRYCLERVAQSAPDNLAELRERGLLP